MTVWTRWCVVVLAVLAAAGAALGQSAPAGNAHPQREILKMEGVINPFGDAPRLSPMAVQQKHDFAQRVDLRPLADLSVYNNGRIKNLETLADETVQELTGRKDYFDLLPEQVGGKTKHRKLKYRPLFTFLDIVIDPGYYGDKAIIGVTYLPLRRELLNRVFTDADNGGAEHAAEVRESWLRLGRITPEMAGNHLQGLMEWAGQGRSDPQLQRGISAIDQSMGTYLSAPRLLLMTPSDDPTDPWQPLSRLKLDSAASKAVFELGDAWRKGDADRVNAAVRTLAAELPKVSSSYPTTRRQLESFYNRADLFEWGMWLYALSMVTLLLAFGTGRSWLRAVGIALLVGAVVTHFGGFALRSYIAERYSIQNQFESMTGVSLFAAIVGLALAAFRRQSIFAAAAAGVGFLILVTATQTGIPGQAINREAAILNTSVLLKYHVTIVLFSYGLISLGMIISLFYLATHYSAKRKEAQAGLAGPVQVAAAALGDDEPRSGAAAVLHDLDRAQMTILQLAFFSLGVGILLGAWWADHSWGRWWAFDPKELWALVTWIVYLIVIHVRRGDVGNKALVTAWLSVLGFLVMLWCYFGVNLLLPGLHAYA